MKSFESFHPVIAFIYFLAVIFITMFTMHPILLGLSLVGSIAFCGMLIGIKKLLSSLLYSLPVYLVIALTNPLFSHRGETILFFLNDNPVTLEAMLYGAALSAMIMSVFYWFKCYHEVMTSDKFIYLFGKVTPKISLLLSMVINFVPNFKRHFNEIDRAQRALGIYTSKSYVDKIRSKIRVLSILISWSLENSVETADSMRARGYGLKGRTSYSIFRWTLRDTFMIIIVLVFTAAVCTALGFNYGKFNYYPALDKFNFGAIPLVLYFALFALVILSTICEIKENILWRYLKSKI